MQRILFTSVMLAYSLAGTLVAQSESSDGRSGPDSCYLPQGSLLKGQTSETRKQYIADLQASMDRKIGRAAVVVVGVLPPNNSRLVVSSLQANKELVRAAEAHYFAIPLVRTQLCLRGFDSVAFIVFQDRKHYETIGSFTTDAGEALNYLKTH